MNCMFLSNKRNATAVYKNLRHEDADNPSGAFFISGGCTSECKRRRGSTRFHIAWTMATNVSVSKIFPHFLRGRSRLSLPVPSSTD